MPRRARIAIPGIAWHIIQRGNNRTPCSYAESAYRVYLDNLGEQAKKHGCQIHGYVRMTNHAELLFTPDRRRGTDDEAPGPALRPVREQNLPPQRNATFS